eukprot:gene3042-64462_t
MLCGFVIPALPVSILSATFKGVSSEELRKARDMEK